jgi:hypothetical protein
LGGIFFLSFKNQGGHRERLVPFKQMWYNAPSWSVNTMNDVDKYLSELREKLAARLGEDTTVNIEF